MTLRVFNAGDNLNNPATAFNTRLDIDVEYPLEALRTCHCGMPLDGGAFFYLIVRLALMTFASFYFSTSGTDHGLLKRKSAMEGFQLNGNSESTAAHGT